MYGNGSRPAIVALDLGVTPGVLITGTDTGVGKTVVTAALAMHLRQRGIDVGVMKPVETGVRSATARSTDAIRLQSAAATGDEIALIRPYAFRAPLAPLAAGRLERKPIRSATIIAAFRRLCARHDCLLIEGVGGVHVPLTQSKEVLDLARQLDVPVIVVGRAGLGGINHARLTIDALQRRNIPVLALVLNRSTALRGRAARQQLRSTVTLLREQAVVPVLGPLPYVNRFRDRWMTAVTAVARTSAIKQLARLLLSSEPTSPVRRGPHRKR